ncbi:hypothetical protein [Pantanalinema sp. GBBB05]|uniref:hypothetical protein n=1 Tax=Pantanalinema sp. GBBB05 TaxID=2604139 RepID=UPI001D879F25|nr:hypothetical protein [Pantanalinema sp. GBBB05]
MNTAHAAIVAHLANGNPELTELYNRCGFALDDTTFTVTCKKKDLDTIRTNWLKLFQFAQAVDAYWVILRTRSQILNRAEVHLALKFHERASQSSGSKHHDA